MDFLNAKFQRLAALDRLLAIAPALEDACAPAITEEEIEAEINSTRARPTRGQCSTPA